MRLSTYGRPALLAAVAALTLGVAQQAEAATVLSAGSNSSCGTSTCFDSHGTYKITFSAAAFGGGPVDISKLLLDRSVLGSLDSHYFSLNFQLNGHQLGSWGNWNMGQIGGDQLSFSGSDLIWNPADGDLVLVMDLVAANGEKLMPDGHGGWFTPAGGGGSAAAPLAPEDETGPDQGGDQGPIDGGFDGGFGQGAGDGFGQDDGDGVVVTLFSPPPEDDRSTGSAAPEPAGWALMLGGFGLAGAALRRRRAATA